MNASSGSTDRTRPPPKGLGERIAHERLQWARERKYESGSDAARAMGVKVPTYLGHENGARRFHKEAARYAEFYGINLDWLMTGRGEPFDGDEISLRVRDLPADKRAQALEYLDFLASRKD